MFDFLSKKKNRYICGINFEKQLNFQLLEIKRINNSFTPTFFRNIKIDGVYEKNIFNRIKFINFFKQYFPYLHSKNINVYLTDSYPKLKKEIEESLKIIGFRKVIFIENKNTLGIIVPNFSASPVSVFYFTKIKVYFIFIKNNKIIYLDEFKIQNFSIKIVENHIEKTKNDNIFITGHFIDNRIDIISKILNKMGLRFKLLNIWQNFLNFSNDIPQISLLDSHQYIDVLSFIVPNLKDRPSLSEEIEKEKILLSKNNTILLPKKHLDENILLTKFKPTKELEKEDQKVEEVKGVKEVKELVNTNDTELKTDKKDKLKDGKEEEKEKKKEKKKVKFFDWFSSKKEITEKKDKVNNEKEERKVEKKVSKEVVENKLKTTEKEEEKKVAKEIEIKTAEAKIIQKNIKIAEELNNKLTKELEKEDQKVEEVKGVKELVNTNNTELKTEKKEEKKIKTHKETKNILTKFYNWLGVKDKTGDEKKNENGLIKKEKKKEKKKE